MNVSTGHWIFAACFAVAFIIAMLWAYGKDKKTSSRHYTKVYLILLFIILFFSILFGIVKLKSHLH